MVGVRSGCRRTDGVNFIPGVWGFVPLPCLAQKKAPRYSGALKFQIISTGGFTEWLRAGPEAMEVASNAGRPGHQAEGRM
ncbi:MAG TPA: hypothetical protein VFE46_02435 [Pirellulales bacterium]|nr:hypothetical protein [Pirellulales bacterium]